MSAVLAEEVEGARLVSLSEVADLVRGVAYPKADAREEPAPGFVPVLRATNIQDASLVLGSDLVFVAERNVSPDQLLRPGDIVVATSSGSKHLVGKSGQLHATWRGSFGAFCAAVRPRPGIHPRYLALFLQTPAYWRQISKKALGVNINNLRRGDLESLELPLPPLAVQASIVAELEKQFSRLDEAVANLKRVKANLKRYKAAVLKAAVEGRLVPTETALATREGRRTESGAELLARILENRRGQWSGRGRYVEPPSLATSGRQAPPKGWVWATAEQLCDFITKGTTPAASKLHDGVGEIQFLKVYNLTFDGSLNHRHKPTFVDRETHTLELARSRVQPGDILINIVGPPLGQVSAVPALISEANINQAIARFRPISPMNERFLALALMSEDIMHWAISRAKTTAGQSNLTLELCRALPLPLPPVAEQQRIVAEFERRMSIARILEDSIEATLTRADLLRYATLSRSLGT